MQRPKPKCYALSITDLVSTMILVASRPSTIAYADSVILLESGRMIAHGTHDELIAQSPDYRALVEALQHT